MKKVKLCAILAGLLCTAALAVACSDKPDGSDTTAAAETTAEITEEMTESVTDEETAETECRLLFEDNFDGTAIDTAKWNIGTPEDQPARTGDIALWDESKVALNGEGHLLLKMEWDKDAKAARSGAVTTKGLFESGYGYYEASIKFPLTYARACHFAVTAEDIEIDVMKSISGHESVTYQHNLRGGGNTSVTVDALQKNLINLYDGRFHTFGLLRSEEGYTFYIDGKESAFVPASDVASTAEEGYISLFWEAPKPEGAGRNETKNSTPSEMIIDYVRVYSSLPDTLGKAEASQAQLVFNDDFDGNEIDNTKWTRCPEWTRNDLMYWKDEMTQVDGEGHLVIRMEYDEEKNMIRGGGAWTASTFTYGYGYYEARMKLPDVYGAWGAFWMMCGDVWKESAKDGVEIDIIESTVGGEWGHALHSNYGNLNSLGNPTMVSADTSDGQFHTFGVLRAETGYFFYIDGMLSAIVPAYIYEPCPIEGRMKLTVESAGWSGGGTPESFASLPAEMIVDYVRVWDSMPEFD